MKPFIFLAVFVFLFSCKDSKKPTYTITKELSNTKKETVANSQDHLGKKLIQTNCYVCHSLTATEENRIAPPMIAIKKRYLMGNTSKQAFINSLQNFIKNPTEENAKMYGAVKRFGVMPKQAFPEETIKQIADYMFEFDLEQPEWFEDHYNEQHGNLNSNGRGMGNGKGNGGGNGKRMQNQVQGNNINSQSFSERGLSYALSTKAELGKNLMRKIQNEGTLAALKFCNIKAFPLTDSMSVVHNATIKRVSDKPRNPKNLANSKEIAYINIFKDDAKLNKESDPIVVESGENVKFYYPIKTNSMCLQCHGKPTSDIKPITLAEIKKLYPNDLAIGYNENQVRGIWSITFNK
jgi:cytochrome c2